jgi:flagellar hook-basal body complex protein FliE
MTSPISAISGIGGLSGVSKLSGVSGVGGAAGVGGTTAIGGSGGDFASVLAKGLENVQASQAKADDLAVKVANGTLADPAQYTMAATEASLGLQLTTAIRNKAVDAFQEIMRMQA